MKFKRTERGWPGHFICAKDCGFRRNTLLESTEGEVRAVVSTVGNWCPKHMPRSEWPDSIGPDRYYETMAFMACKEGEYWEADVSRQIDFDGERAINKKSMKKNKDKIDSVANEMHEKAIIATEKALEAQ